MSYWFKNCFFSVIEIVLFFSSVISLIGLEKLSTLDLEGSGVIFGSLFLKGDKLPSGNKKLVSLGSGASGTIGCLERGGESRSQSKRRGGPLIGAGAGVPSQFCSMSRQ